jgi:hypothetical protein
MTSSPNFRWPAHHWSIQPPTKRGTCDVRCQRNGNGGCVVCDKSITSIPQTTHGNQHRKCWNHPALFTLTCDRTTTFRRPLGRRRRMVECLSLCAGPQNRANCARIFNSDITTKRSVSMATLARKVRTLLEVRQTLGHGEAPADGVCRIGNTRRQTRAMVAEASLPPLYVLCRRRALAGDGGSLFGTILSQDDHDLSACVRYQRAKTQWAAVSKVPEARGVSKKSFARLYLVMHGPAVRK